MSWGWWNPGDAAPIVAVAIGSNDDGSTHTGVVYRADETGEQLRLLHLRFHHLLSDVPFPQATRTVAGIAYHLLIPKQPRTMLQAGALRCRSIARERPKIPFGFASTRITFDARGRAHAPADNRGLNCATFVLRVLESVSVRLIDESTWQHRAEDQERFTCLHGQLRDYVEKVYRLDPVALREQRAYVDRIAPDVRSIRVRPEEVAGACLSESLPVLFTQGAVFSGEVLSRIRPLPPSQPAPPAT
jgi:hypothetical protein